jgi:hypothetical protein
VRWTILGNQAVVAGVPAWPQRAELRAVQRVNASATALRSVDVQAAVPKINLRPAQLTKLSRARRGVVNYGWWRRICAMQEGSPYKQSGAGYRPQLRDYLAQLLRTYYKPATPMPIHLVELAEKLADRIGEQEGRGGSG